MSTENILTSACSKWMEGSGPDNDVVISSRIRLARNISGFSFPHFISQEQAVELVNKVKAVVTKEEVEKEIGLVNYTDLSVLSEEDRLILVEKHLISPQHVENPENRGVITTADESVSIMVNEEDHLRIQCLLPGLQLEESWRLANKLDDLLEKDLDYSFCEKRGFLTSCPTNVGTGLRASVMMHLPGLMMTKQINQVLRTISQLGLAVRGYYGEGTEATGNLFQISNQVTMGQTEEEIIKNLLTVTKQLVIQERNIRHMVFKENPRFLEDKIYRSIGIMRYARLTNSREALQNISNMRLGVELGILKAPAFNRINELIVLTRPAFLMKRAGRLLNREEQDGFRAEVIREHLSDITFG